MRAFGSPGRVGAVVINYNGGDRALRCIEALVGQTRPLDRILVVDNASEDGSPERIRSRWPTVHVLALPENIGLPRARNLGLDESGTELVVMVDSDVYLEPDALEWLIRAQEETGATVACPRIRLLPERDIVQAEGAAPHFLGTMTLLGAYRPVDQAEPGRRQVPGGIGACYLLRRDPVREAGGFHESYFFYFEDLEFLLRLQGLGYEAVYEPEALVYHERGSGTPGLSFRGSGTYPTRRAYLSMRNRWLTILLHYRTRTLFVLAPALLVYEAAILAFALPRGCGGAWLRGWGWQLRHLRGTLAERRELQRRRVRSDRDILLGGAIPLAPGVLESPLTRIPVRALSGALNAWWKLVRPLAG